MAKTERIQDNTEGEDKGKMDKKKKIISGIIGIGCVALIGYGVYSYNTPKDIEVEEITAEEIQATDSAEDDSLLAESIQDQSESVNIEEYEGGNGMGEDAEIEDEYDQAYQDQLDAESAESDSPTTTPSTTTTTDFEVQSLDSQTKYAKQQVNVRKGPGIDYEKTGSLSTNEEVTVIGLCPTDHGDWYELGDEERNVVGYVSATYLVDSKVAVSNSNSGNSGSTASNSGTSSSSSNSSSSSSSSSSSDAAAASAALNDVLSSGIFSGPGSAVGGIDGSVIPEGSGNGAGITVY